jgi:hypothetical protein
MRLVHGKANAPINPTPHRATKAHGVLTHGAPTSSGTEVLRAREQHDEPDAPAPHIRYHRECCLSDYRTDAAPDPTLSPDIAHPD